MFGPIQTDGFPTINDHAGAQRAFDKIKPWRGGNEHERPLGNRRDKHKQLVLLNNGDFACRLYSTDVVTYHRDNTISIRRYDTASTVEFANAILPWELRTTLHLGQMWVCMTTMTDPDRWPHDSAVRHYLREGKERLRFQRIATPTGPSMAFRCVNPEANDPAKRLLLDKTRTKQVREILRPFEQWAKAVLGLNEGRPPQQVAGSVHVRSLLNGDLQPDDYPHLLVWYSRHDYYRQCRVMQGNWLDALRTDAYRHMHAFVEEVVPITELPKPSKWGIR